MFYIRTLIIVGCLALGFSSCKTNSKKEPVSDSGLLQVTVRTENLDEELFACKTVQDVQSFLDKHPYLSEWYFTDAPVAKAELPAHLFQILQNKDFRAFKIQLDSIIGDRNVSVINPLKEAFGQIAKFYPQFKAPEVKFMVTGFAGNDLYISDSLIVIGLDYFGGPKAMYRPDVYDYQLKRYQKEYIVPSIIFFMSNKYNHVNASDRTLLADMIGYGKGYEFVKQVMPNAPDSLILGYSEESLARTYNSQEAIWSFFVSNKLLYENTDLKKQKFIGERPFTTEIGNEVPGGIGRWIGWRIVSRYMAENPNVTLPELMKNDNAANLLQASGYKGQKDEEE
ncbi:gliding motility protein GldB-related protein [Dyadobacter frigoris]|uniref:Gliding motility protein n=1 Tax=Dyadobacter frigoris TaxID=2576211 RepID=A0A4U6D3F2_9BACT|nr:gliding motility protein [Dyadobacter frigoris]TKT91166.1 gliding motility protein [Dyadobacter frigoris]GLU55095.1 hypothetical protein Dfri01_45560 [Dyadobacter frigoris]